MNDKSMLEKFDCVVFDMDGTLAVSKGPISTGMAQCLNRLLKIKKVAVISGGVWKQFEKQLISFLDKENFDNLLILPTSGTSMHVFKNSIRWAEIYSEIIPLNERKRIVEEINLALKVVGYHEAETFGLVVEDRISQITFEGLGSDAPFSKKVLWDPNQKKRDLIIAVLKNRIPEYTITIGGTTSIDITMHGVDKAYGVEKLSKNLDIPLSKILFIGDKLHPGGNDYPVKRLSIETLEVKDEHETENLLESWLT